jgi:hypothetical protein
MDGRHLEDCPFCGAADDGHSVRVASDKELALHVAFCPECEAQGPHVGSVGEAVSSWNKACNKAQRARADKAESKLKYIKGTVADCFDGADTDDVEEVIRAVSNLFSAAYLRIAELEKRIADALAYAGNHFCEWGERAEMVEAILRGEES